jgi:hypothetical protein
MLMTVDQVPDIKIATTWAVLEATDDELMWAGSIGAQVSCTQETVDVGYHWQALKMALGNRLIEIYSESEEINTLLRLRFTDRLVPVRTDRILSQDTCTLSETNFES